MLVTFERRPALSLMSIVYSASCGLVDGTSGGMAVKVVTVLHFRAVISYQSNEERGKDRDQ